MTYLWRFGYPYQSRGSVEIVGKALGDVERKYGALTPANVVKASRPRTSPLHNFIEWDTRRAALEYRLEQARGLVRAVIVIPDEATAETRVRAFLHIVDRDQNNERKYVGLDEAMKHPAYRQQVLEQALRELRTFRAKYHALRELAGVFQAIEAATARGEKSVAVRRGG